MHRVLASAVLGVGVAACSGPAPATPEAIGAATWRLPEANWLRDGQTLLCAGGGWIGATIHGSPRDPAVVWVERGGERIRLAWPTRNFIARFAPDLEVVNARGNVIFREGDPVDGGCETADRGIWRIDLP